VHLIGFTIETYSKDFKLQFNNNKNYAPKAEGTREDH
jgi:hypothetical protein